MTSKHIWIMAVIFLVTSLISRFLLDDYGIEYRFYRKVLRKRWIYELLFWSALVSFFAFFALAWFVPSWWTFILGGALNGVICELVPIFNTRVHKPRSYREMCDIYIKNAHLWERNLKKAQEKRAKRRKKRQKKS